MPVGFSSAARNLFLLGSTGSVASNFFKQVDESANSLGTWIPKSIIYNDADEKYILGGYHKDSNTKDHGWISKRDYDAETDPENPTTTEEWSVGSQYTVPNGGSVRFNSIKLDSNGKVIIAGDFNSGTGNRPLVARYSATGILEWQATSNYVGGANDITSDDNNNYYICGTDGLGEAFVEKYDTDGNPIWGKVISTGNANTNTTLQSIGVNNRGEVVAGGTLDATNPHRGYLVKINTDSGEVLWDKTFYRAYDQDGNTTFGYNAVVKILQLYVDTRDQIYVTGVYGSPSRQWIAKLTPEGNIIWQRGTTNTTNVMGGQDIMPIGIRSDGETEQTIVLSRQADTSQLYLILSKYSKSGELVWRRKLDKGNAFSASPLRSYGISLDADPSFYYISYVDQSYNAVSGTPDAYYFGKVSSSGNGIGAFDYDDGSAVALEYTVSSQTDTTERLKDGSVRNDTSDMMSYPFTADQVIFDDLATPVANKKRRVTGKDTVDFSGSPAIRTRDFPSVHLLASEYSGTGNWLDKSKNENNGVLVNPSHESDPPDHFEINNTRRIELQNYSVSNKTDFSVETWVKFDSLSAWDTSSGYIWDQSTDNSGCSLRVLDTSGKELQITLNPSGTSLTYNVTGTTVQTDIWYHVVTTFDAPNDGVSMYIDGGKLGTSSLSWSQVKSLSQELPFTIGSSARTLSSTAGEAVYTTPGTYELDVSGLSSVSAVLVGGGGGGSASTSSSNGVSGGGGGGGALSWINNLDVSGESTLYITVGSGGDGGSIAGQNNANAGDDSYLRFNSHSGTIVSRAGGGGKGEYNNPSIVQNGGVDYSSTYGGGGGNGGRGGRGQSGHQCGGGGGAGGYSGNGGMGSDGSGSTATDGSGGGGGGAGGLNSTGNYLPIEGGGGVGIYGEGTNGQAGISRSGTSASDVQESRGYAGSGGTSKDPSTSTQEKGYGGGGTGNEDDGDNGAADGAGGAVRVIWGTNRSFPSTNVEEDAGGSDTREYMDGDIAEFRIYDHVLTDAQVYQNYNATKSKYINQAIDTAPLVTSNIVVNSNLLLHYDFGNRACYEPAENIIRHSEDFKVDAAETWGENSVNWLDNSKIIANYALSPFKWDKEMRASKVLNDTGSSKYINFRPNNFVNGSYNCSGQHTISLYAKAISNPCKIAIGQWDGFNFRNTNFDLVSGVVDSTSNTDATSIQALGDGWYRISSTATNQSSNTAYQMQLVDALELLMMGAQMEKGNLSKYNRTYGTPLSPPNSTKNLADGGVVSGQGQIFGAAFNGDGYFGFDGTNDKIQVSNPLAASAATPFTMEAWAQIAALGSWQTVCSIGGSNTQIAFSSGNTIRVGRNGGGGGVNTNSGVTATTNTWYHIVGSYDGNGGNDIKIYVNGQLEANTTMGSNGNDNSGDFRVGAYGISSGGEWLNGNVGECRLYNAALSTAQVEQNFNATRAKYGV